MTFYKQICKESGREHMFIWEIITGGGTICRDWGGDILGLRVNKETGMAGTELVAGAGKKGGRRGSRGPHHTVGPRRNWGRLRIFTLRWKALSFA